MAPALAKMPVRPAGIGQASGGGMASRNRAAMGGGQHERMSAVDTAWLRMDRPTNRMVIVGVLLFDQAVDYDRLLATFAARFMRFGKRFS